MAIVSRNMVPKSSLIEFHSQSSQDFASLRETIRDLQSTEFQSLHRTLSKTLEDVESISRTSADDVARAHGGVRLDVNLEKARIEKEASELEAMVLKAEEKIEREVKELGERLEMMRVEMTASLRNVIFVIVGTFVGYKLQSFYFSLPATRQTSDNKD